MFNSYLKLETWFTSFVIDYAIYKGKYEDAVQYLHKIKDTNLLLRKNINIAGILYVKENYRVGNCVLEITNKIDFFLSVMF
jgi:hypothetical protein